MYFSNSNIFRLKNQEHDEGEQDEGYRYEMWAMSTDEPGARSYAPGV